MTHKALPLAVAFFLGETLYGKSPLVELATLESWLDQTAKLESGYDDNAVGDGGRSRGRYQIQAGPWKHYSTKPWKRFAHEPVEAGRVARLILVDCAKKCVKVGKPVTFKNVRWYYRHGGW